VTFWASLGLWEDEEKQIHQCLQSALQQLISQKVITINDEENLITKHLYAHIQKISKQLRLNWTTHPQASSYDEDASSEPAIHPDIRFSRRDTEHDQYDYDVECKLVRIAREGTSTDYCYNYIKHGVMRYHLGHYARSFPAMGTILGYIQDGDIENLFDTINDKAIYQRLSKLEVKGKIRKGGITTFDQKISRNPETFTLFHLWADFR
jgi:hypothetical protein